MRRALAILALAALATSTPASAQIPGLGGGAGILGAVLPQAGIDNVAGLLGYCLKNRLLGQAGAKSVLGTLTGRKDVTDSEEYSDGEEGILHANDATFPLGDLKGKVKTKVCNLVLSRARDFL